MNDESSGPELIYVDKSNKHFYDDIKFLQGYDRKDQFLFAMAFGFINDFNPKIDKREFITRTSYLNYDDLTLINSLALLNSKGNVDILSDKKEIFRIAEDYANGGIQLLSDETGSKHGSFEKKLEKILVDIYDQIGDLENKSNNNQKSEIDKYLIEGENEKLEFKASFKWSIKDNGPSKELEKPIAKTIAAFLNSKGGILLIGINDNGSIFGIEKDLNYVQGKDIDGYQKKLREIIQKYLGLGCAGNIKIKFAKKEDKNVCIITVEKSKQAVYLKDKANNDAKEFYVRIGSTSNSLDTEQAVLYITNNF